MKINNRPNILYIFTDQQSAEALTCAGNHEIKTPAADSLAKNGVRFEKAYCTYPLCSPSRASMFTGKMPHEVGVITNDIHISDSDRKKSIGILLSEIGYDCAYGGKWHIPELEIPEGPKGYGFKRICGFKDDSLAQSCIKFIRKKRDTPFFLVASFDNPHNICEWRRTQALPWGDVPEPRSLDECPNLPANFEIPPFEPEVIRLHQKINPRVYAQLSYSQEDWRKYRYAYFRLVEKVDAEIGKIISALKKLKLDEDTLVIFSSDHGDSNGVHRLNQKTVLYEGPVHVP